MRIISFSVVLSFLVLSIYGCSKTSEAADLQVKPKSEAVTVVPNKLLSLEISGMTCEMGCGSEIRKALISTGAVERVKFDFKMGRDVNKAEISFDNTKISEDKIAEIVSEMNNKQFSVGESTTVDYDNPENKDTETTTSSTSSKKLSVSISDVEPSESFGVKIPNLIDLLVSVLIRK